MTEETSLSDDVLQASREEKRYWKDSTNALRETEMLEFERKALRGLQGDETKQACEDLEAVC